MAKKEKSSGASALTARDKKQFKWKWHVKFHKLITISARRTKPHKNPNPMQHNAPIVWLPAPIPSIHHAGLVRGALDPYNPVRIWDLQYNCNIRVSLPGQFLSLSEYARWYFGSGYDHYHIWREYHHDYHAMMYHHVLNQNFGEVRRFDNCSHHWHEYYTRCYHWWLHNAFQDRHHHDHTHNMQWHHRRVSASSNSVSADQSCLSKMDEV